MTFQVQQFTEISYDKQTDGTTISGQSNFVKATSNPASESLHSKQDLDPCSRFSLHPMHSMQPKNYVQCTTTLICGWSTKMKKKQNYK